MAKFKPARKKSKSRTPAPGGGIPCLILLASFLVLTVLFIIFYLKYASA